MSMRNGREGWAQVAVLAFVAWMLALSKGGVLEWSQALFVSAVAVLLLIRIAVWMRQAEVNGEQARAWLRPWLVLSALIAMQLVPLPAWLLDFLGAYPPEIRSQGLVSRISAMPLATVAWWSLFTAYWTAAWMVSRMTAGQARVTVMLVVGLGVVQALYGLVAYAGGQETILGIWDKRHYLEDATGTFVNRNHFAGLLAMAWPLGLALLLDDRRSDHRHREVGLLLLAVSVSVLFAVALTASHSRLGIATAIAGVIAWYLAQRQAGAVSRVIPGWFAWVVGVVTVLAMLWFGLEVLVRRLLILPGDDRFAIWTALLELPWQTWLLGGGAGAFQDIFRTVQPATLDGFFRFAHGDWMELVVELGVVGTGVLVWATLAWARRCWPGPVRGLRAGAIGALCAIALHSLGDFNLRVPGSAMVAWLALGLLFNSSLGETAKPEPSAGKTRKPAATARRNGKLLQFPPLD
ncbi:MAG: O-antigen ligase family protein [Gammaproteobacteria bacterium]|nr:O-antigen ligase family protein [Gammaproteobacteria bacterium]